MQEIETEMRKGARDWVCRLDSDVVRSGEEKVRSCCDERVEGMNKTVNPRKEIEDDGGKEKKVVRRWGWSIR